MGSASFHISWVSRGFTESVPTRRVGSHQVSQSCRPPTGAPAGPLHGQLLHQQAAGHRGQAAADPPRPSREPTGLGGRHVAGPAGPSGFHCQLGALRFPAAGTGETRAPHTPVCVHVCVCAHVGMCVHCMHCMGMCTCTCTCVHTSVHVCTHTYGVCVCARTYICTHVRMHVGVCVRTGMCVCACARLHVCSCACAFPSCAFSLSADSSPLPELWPPRGGCRPCPCGCWPL